MRRDEGIGAVLWYAICSLPSPALARLRRAALIRAMSDEEPRAGYGCPGLFRGSDGTGRLPARQSEQGGILLGYAYSHVPRLGRSFRRGIRAFCRSGPLAGRVASEYRDLYLLYTERGDVLAKIMGKMRYGAVQRADLPAVGDWVVFEALLDAEGVVHAVLPRRTKFWRKVAGVISEEQILAANVDTVFLVAGLDGDFNPRRLERYLIMTWESGADPVILLNKADLARDLEQMMTDLAPVAMGVPVHAVSCTLNQGLDALAPYLAAGRTVALLGSSGVGKSTLVNLLMGRDLQAVGSVRFDDSHGRHTTTNRQLIRLPGGGLVIDTPGMRELQLWEATAGLDGAFTDIADFARFCRFRDCRHRDEPGCAVMEAVDLGKLPSERLQSYRKLQKELAYQHRKEDPTAMRAEKERWKKIHMAFRREGPK